MVGLGKIKWGGGGMVAHMRRDARVFDATTYDLAEEGNVQSQYWEHPLSGSFDATTL
jgi:hypothetical protein